MKTVRTKKPNGQTLAAIAAVRKHGWIFDMDGNLVKHYKDNEGNEFLVYEDQNNQVILTERLED